MYMEVRCHPTMIAYANITVGSNSYEEVGTFKYLGFLLKSQNPFI
jgi:hypothetical protein